MKKLISALILGTWLFVISVNSAFAFFEDVSPNHEYYEEILGLYELGILKEDSTGLFHPDEKLTYPGLYEMIINYGGAELSEEIDLPYSDTSNTASYAKYLQTAIDIGLLKAKNGSEIGVNKSVTKHRTLSTMFKAFGIGIDYFFDKDSFLFKDVNPNSETGALAQKAGEIGIFEENSKIFRMAKTITRGEAANYLYKIYQYKPDAGLQVIYVYTENSGSSAKITKDKSFDTFSDIWNRLKTDYYYEDEIDKKELIFDAIRGMLTQVADPYTIFQEPNIDNGIVDAISSEYEGIGISIDLINDQIVIVSPFRDSPAEEAGIRAGDIILKVNGDSAKGKGLDWAVSKLKGEAGTKVSIQIERDGSKKTFNITRAVIRESTVYYSELVSPSGRNIAYLEISTFGLDTYDEFLAAAETLMKNNTNGIILDLRNNPGGYTSTAIKILSMFTDKIKTAMQFKFSDNSVSKEKTNGNGMLKDIKTVILVNKGSASAAEIVAGAMQDYGIAKLIGTQTFGKGTVQQLLEYPDGSVFKYTISKWLTPDGRDITGEGLTPDKIVENTGEKDKQLESALSEF